MPNYTEEKFKVMGLNGQMVEVVKTIIPDDETQKEFVTLRIQEITKS